MLTFLDFTLQKIKILENFETNKQKNGTDLSVF